MLPTRLLHPQPHLRLEGVQTDRGSCVKTADAVFDNVAFRSKSGACIGGVVCGLTSWSLKSFSMRCLDVGRFREEKRAGLQKPDGTKPGAAVGPRWALLNKDVLTSIQGSHMWLRISGIVSDC